MTCEPQLTVWKLIGLLCCCCAKISATEYNECMLSFGQILKRPCDLDCVIPDDSFQEQVDLENTGVCTMASIVTVTQYDIYNVYAQPPQDNKGTRDRCTVKFAGEGGRKFKLYVRDLAFQECQVYIRIYDGDLHLNTPRWQIGCSDGAGISLSTFNSEIAISLEKADATSTGYKFYILLATEDGPDITSAEVRGEETLDSLSGGMIAGIVVGAVLFIVVVVAMVIYCLYAHRRRKEEKEAYAHSMSTLLPTAESTRGGSSVHSSVHNSVHSSKHSTHSTHHSIQSYPAYRTTISEKDAKCNSIDTKSQDSEQASSVSEKPMPIRSVKHEFDSMRRGLMRENYKKEQEKEDLRLQEKRRQEVQKSDRESRAESNKGLGRRSRSRDRQPVLTDENIKKSLRAARERGRSFDERDSGRGSTRSKTRNKSYSGGRSHKDNRADSDYYSEAERPRDRSRTRGESSRQRSASASSYSRRRYDYDESDNYSDYSDRRSRSSHHTSRSHRRDRYDDRDDYSDYDDRSRRTRHDSRNRNESGQRSRRDSLTQRSGTQRSRSQSAGRRQR